MSDQVRALEEQRQFILRIVADWCAEYYDIGGIDAGDLEWRLKEAGFPLPADGATPADFPALAAAREEGRRAGLAEVADHFAEAYDVAATGQDLIAPPEHMRKRANDWMSYLLWSRDHARAYADLTSTRSTTR